VRRWIEFTAAMITSKLLLVIIFAIGASALNGAGSTGSGAGQDATQLATGSLILLLGGLAPWVAIRMFHFAGDAIHAAHATATQATAGGATLVSMPQKASRLYFQGRAAIGSPRPPAPSLRQGRPPASLFASPNPPTQGPTAGTAAEHHTSVKAGPRGAGPLPHSAASSVHSEPPPHPSTPQRDPEPLVQPTTHPSPKG
jgi:hypothetical protein